MVTRGNIGTVVGCGLLAETVAFTAVASWIGFGSAVVLSFALSLLGALMLRRSGSAALSSLRTAAVHSLTRETALVDGMLGALGAILLIVPGFLTDVVGLVLLAPSGRQWLVRRLGVVSPGHGSAPARQVGTIDLGNGDWTRLDNRPSR